MKYPSAMWPSNVRAPRVGFGILNGFLLLSQASLRDYITNLWIPERVLRELNARLRTQSERPVAIRNYDDEGNHIGERRVFNIEQVHEFEKTLGLTFEVVKRIASTKRYTRSQKLLDRLKENRGLRIKYHQMAAYSPSSDVVMMPRPEHFDATIDERTGAVQGEGVAHYWATLWHEVIHWTGHRSRLNRERHIKWGDDVYAFEELVAELGSAYLCAYLEIEGELQHPAYVEHWCEQLMKEKEEGRDPLSSLRAASLLASRAKDFVLERRKKASQVDSRGF